jgi:hypothetical protein
MLVATMAERAVAGVVVNWGGDFFSQNAALHPGSGSGTGNDQYADPVVPYKLTDDPYKNLYISGRAVADNVPYSPYPTGSNLHFYGGHAVLSTVAGETARRMAILGQGASDDELHADLDRTDTLQKFAMLAYWKVPSTELSNTSVFSLASKQDAQGEGGHTLRWVVRKGMDFYISSGVGLNFSNNSLYRSVMGSLQWQAYSPTLTDYDNGAELRTLFYEPLPTPLSIAFNGVTGLGFYVEYDRPDSLNGNPARGVDYKITGFNVNSVPEPGTFLLGLAGFGGVALKRWRQRRKSSGTDASQLTEAAT